HTPRRRNEPATYPHCREPLSSATCATGRAAHAPNPPTWAGHETSNGRYSETRGPPDGRRRSASPYGSPEPLEHLSGSSGETYDCVKGVKLNGTGSPSRD